MDQGKETLWGRRLRLYNDKDEGSSEEDEE